MAESGSFEGLVEVLANVALVVLTPVALVWLQSGLVMVIEAVGKLRMEESEILGVCLLSGNHEQPSCPRPAQAVAEHE
jgi:hypothetical protein